MRKIAVLGLSLTLASAAQAGPALFEASFIMHAFGTKINPLTLSPSFIALPLGHNCQHAIPYTTNGGPFSRYCAGTILTRGSPATGSGTISVATTAPAPIALPQSALGITASGFLPTHPPYLQSHTYATFVNAAGTFFAGGGAAAGLGQRIRTGMGVTRGTWIINEGANGFGGALGILGQFGAHRKFTATGTIGTYEGTSNWNMTQALGRTPYATTIGTTPMGFPLYQNPYVNSGMFTRLTPMGLTVVATVDKRGSGTLWTTGMITMYAPIGSFLTVFQRTGHDTTTPGGVRNVQLVTPALTHWISPVANQHTGHFGILSIRLIPPADTDNDTVPDALDNCVNVPNAGAQSCDTDQDGYGNVCDADLNNDAIVGGPDYATFGGAWLTAGASDADLNCDLVVGVVDLATFAGSFAGAPGPSGLACAGTVPCE